MERRVFTYKDVEEARKYIGKRGRFSDCLEEIETGGGDIGRLSDLRDDKHYPFRLDKLAVYQFYSPNPEPVEKWVPFTAEDWPSFSGKFVTRKEWCNLNAGVMILGFRYDGISVGGLEDYDDVEYQDLLEEWTFIDSSPCGKKVVE